MIFKNFSAQLSKFLSTAINSPLVPDGSEVFLKFPNFLKTLSLHLLRNLRDRSHIQHSAFKSFSLVIKRNYAKRWKSLKIFVTFCSRLKNCQRRTCCYCGYRWSVVFNISFLTGSECWTHQHYHKISKFHRFQSSVI